MLDISGTITTGGAAQDLIAAPGTPISWFVQNLSTSVDLYVRDDGQEASAGVGSIKIPPGALYETPEDYRIPGQAKVSIFSTLTGHAFTARRY
jgi:hypothetical protein